MEGSQIDIKQQSMEENDFDTFLKACQHVKLKIDPRSPSSSVSNDILIKGNSTNETKPKPKPDAKPQSRNQFSSAEARRKTRVIGRDMEYYLTKRFICTYPQCYKRYSVPRL